MVVIGSSSLQSAARPRTVPPARRRMLAPPCLGTRPAHPSPPHLAPPLPLLLDATPPHLALPLPLPPLCPPLPQQGDDAWMQRLELEGVSGAKGAAGMERSATALKKVVVDERDLILARCAPFL